MSVLTKRLRCPTCGSPVVLAAGDEGTNHYVPANSRQVTEAFAELDRLRAEQARDCPRDETCVPSLGCDHCIPTTSLEAELARAVEARENANTVSVRVEAENQRLRAIIGSLYEARGQSREGLYCAIKQAYRAMEGSL